MSDDNFILQGGRFFLLLCTFKSFPPLLFQPHGSEEVTSMGQQKLCMSQATV